MSPIVAQSDRSIAEEDGRWDSATLVHVLAEHPTQLRIEDLYRELTQPAGNATEERDFVDMSVNKLCRKGLLFRAGELILPTQAALYFNEIMG